MSLSLKEISKKFLSCFLICFLLIGALIGCAANPDADEARVPTADTAAENDSDKNDESDASEKKLDEIHQDDFLSHLTETEIKYVEAVGGTGAISFGTRINSSIYEVLDDGSKAGFHYKLALSFAEALGLEAEFVIFSFEDYFKVDGAFPLGVKTIEDEFYNPDIFEEVLIIADNLTMTPWRKRMMSFSEIIPVGVVVLTSGEYYVDTFDDLKSKTIAVVAKTTYEQIALDLSVSENLDLKFIFVESSDLALEKLMAGEVDFTLKDSNTAFHDLKIHPELNVNMAVGAVGQAAWAMKRDNVVLQGIVDKYMDYALETGIMDDIWEEEMGISLLSYSKFLNVLEKDNE